MYGYEWTDDYGIFRLTIDSNLQKEIRPVFKEELDFFGMDEYWDYPKDATKPLLWAEGVRRYVMNGVCVAEAKGGGFYTKPTIKLNTEERLKLQEIDTDKLYEVNKNLMLSLEQYSIHFIREQHEKYGTDCYSYVCAFSGGKDSIVLLDLCAKALAPTEFYVVFSDTGMELSDTYKAVERAKDHWPDLRFYTAKCHMEATESWNKFGPPASRLRWCCSVHKSVPTVLLLKKLATDKGKVVVYDGVRAEESFKRSKYDEVAEGVKNALQVNCHAILKWGSSEAFVYLLYNNILLNDAYKFGIYRVGCMACPMAAQWQDSLISFNYHDDVKPFIDILENITVFAKKRLDKSYVEGGGWKARTGGRVIPQGENRIVEEVNNNSLIFTITNATQDFNDVIPIFGTYVDKENGDNTIKTKTSNYKINYQVENDKQIIKIYPFKKLDRYEISTLRGIVNKTAYCVGCNACIPQCPTEAFQINNGRIQIRYSKCIHCYNCIAYTDKGCMVAKSLQVKVSTMENPDKYKNFGLRQNFLEHFMENGMKCFEMEILGTAQYVSLRRWLFESGIISSNDKKSSEITKLGEKLVSFGPYNPFTWAIIWSNLAYNSVVAKCFCSIIGAGAVYESFEVIDTMDDSYSEKTRQNATNALLNTFRYSPIGSAIGQGISISKTSYLRDGWQDPDAVALLYSLYLYAEHVKRHKFTFTELAKCHDNLDSPGMSPADIYGIDNKQFRNFIQGLAMEYPDYIHVSFINDLDNIVLEEKYTSLDILDLAEE